MNQSKPTSPTRIAFIRASWHADIVLRALDGFKAEIEQLCPQGTPSIDAHVVPGAYEIPLLAQKIARAGQHTAIVACALVVDGGIYRHEFVAGAVIDGLMRVQLDTEVPVFSVVLTPKDFHEHSTHREFFTNHFVGKGAEAARACVQTLAAHEALGSIPA